MEPLRAPAGDAARGDATPPTRGVEESWRIVDPILDTVTPVYEYEPHTWGPSQAQDLITGIGHWDDPSDAALH